MIAVILESGELERITTGLSLLVSAASEGRPARALVTYGALGALLDEELEARALAEGAAPHVAPEGRAVFARTLAELRAAARELDDVRIWACAAAVQATGADWTVVNERLDGVLSTPAFLREAAGAELVVL